jgi:hypothetical protein
MDKHFLNVPVGVRYVSDWVDYISTYMPKETCIIDKTATGCGYTEFCIRSPRPTILCSPRKVLLENKKAQHPESNVFLLRNKGEKGVAIDDVPSEEDIRRLERFELNIGKSGLMAQLRREFLGEGDNEDDTEDGKKYIKFLVDSVKNHITSCLSNGQAPKILVTYDSFKHVLKAFNDLGPSVMGLFDVVVDEFQSIFTDSKFKATVELDFVEYLQDFPRVYYLSATPMLEKYLEQIPEFQNLPYYKFVWPPEIVTKPSIYRKRVAKINKPILKIIKDYLSGRFPTKLTPTGEMVESREVVFYVNSVTSIVSIIKSAGLTGREDLVNILCADVDRNRVKLDKIKMGIGTVPLYGQPHKMFTFCTRTVYLGADFYSPCASTVIASDCMIDSLTVDISLDLPQILGRQRLESNPFAHCATLYYTLETLDIPRADYDNLIARKNAATVSILTGFNDFDSDPSKKATYDIFLGFLRDNILKRHFTDSYAGVSEKTGKACDNNLVRLADQRAYDVNQDNYKDEVAILGSLVNQGMAVTTTYDQARTEVNAFIESYNSICTDFRRSYQYVCEILPVLPSVQFDIALRSLPQEIVSYYMALGPEKSKALDYRQDRVTAEYNALGKESDLKIHLLSLFFPGYRYTLKDIKEKIREVYNTLGITGRTPKASLLLKYYNIKPILTPPNKETGKRENGYEILGYK